MRKQIFRATKATKLTYNKKAKHDKYVVRWLGLQNSKYVALPKEWVEDNIDGDIIDEAMQRGMAYLKGEKNYRAKERFFKLPPGNAHKDDPPINIRDDHLGLNYYYQGKIDNCLMGSFANALSRLLGVTTARKLLETWNPSHHTSLDRWTKFQDHAIKIICTKKKQVYFEHQRNRFDLTTDDTMPIVLQLKGNDRSETHAVTVFRNQIYDSASQYV